jgi:large subunit ribosomal protein L27
VGCGKDHTLFAKADGHVRFLTRGRQNRKFVTVEPVSN